MAGTRERNCQIRMSSSLWNLVGEISQELGPKDGRGKHSAIIREMVAAAAAKWMHSPYVCRSAFHTVYVTKEGNFFSRLVQVLRLNSHREKLPTFVEIKPEKREDYHNKYRESNSPDEHQWLLSRWLINHFAAWSGKKNPDELEHFQQRPLSAHVDTFGTTYKSADLAVHTVGGRFLTREVIVGLRDYVQWKDPNTPVFDRVDIPIDIPTSNLEVCVVVDRELFAFMEVEEGEIPNLALEFRNRESARFEGREVALYPEIGFEERSGRSPDDEGANDMLLRVRRLRQRVSMILEDKASSGMSFSAADKSAIDSALSLPQDFLFYWLQWPSPHLGIEACVRWEKPIRARG